MRGWVPFDELSIISAGEISGNVHQALDDIIYMNDTKKKVKGALAGIIYPVVLLLTTCLYLHIFGTQVVPAFSGILPVEKWQGAGRTMYYLAVFVQDYLVITLLSFMMVILLILATLSRWTGRLRLFFDRFIPWSIYKTIIGCGFLLSLASLINAGRVEFYSQSGNRAYNGFAKSLCQGRGVYDSSIFQKRSWKMQLLYDEYI